MATGFGDMHRVVFSDATEFARPTKAEGFDSVKVLSAGRILFGAIFLFDGFLKWLLFQQGQMQGVVQGFGVDFFSNNWVAFGLLVAVGETLAGAAIMLGLFQRPAAISASAIMVMLWAYSGYGGWGTPGYTDPGGDLMLALIFAVLVFVPASYGLASRLKLRERWGSSSLRHRMLRFLVA